jgi:transcriptional regulator with GAF, ATPase, and Fis domain
MKVAQLVAADRQRLLEENQLLRHELRERYELRNLIGNSHAMGQVFEQVAQAAPANTTVLIRGESGTGKELVARAIHYNSPRAEKPFIKVSCGALPETLIESELFGVEAGAYTDARHARPGRFELAHGGTLFLDEIGELSLATQVKLLRVLQERRFRRLGATEERAVDVRIIAATNRDLRARAGSGAFREDLYYRLNILQIEMPPLRERPEDLPVLAEHFIRRSCWKLGKPLMQLHPETMSQLLAYRFPGNVRELENLMERCVALNPGGPITRELLPEGFGQSGQTDVERPAPLVIPPEGFDLEGWIQALKGHFLRRALDEVGGVKTKAGKRLGMSFRAYRYWLAELGGLEALPKDFPWPAEFPPPAVEEGGGTEGPKEA